MAAKATRKINQKTPSGFEKNSKGQYICSKCSFTCEKPQSMGQHMKNNPTHRTLEQQRIYEGKSAAPSRREKVRAMPQVAGNKGKHRNAFCTSCGTSSFERVGHFCGKCGSKQQSGWSFCPGCGARTLDEPKQQELINE